MIHHLENIRDKCYKVNTIVEKYLLDFEGIHAHIHINTL